MRIAHIFGSASIGRTWLSGDFQISSSSKARKEFAGRPRVVSDACEIHVLVARNLDDCNNLRGERFDAVIFHESFHRYVDITSKQTVIEMVHALCLR